MPFRFSPDQYKNAFPVEVVESATYADENNPLREYWQLTYVRLQLNAQGEWEPMPPMFTCQLPGCAIVPAHVHTRLYESDKPGTPAHRFITGLKEKAFIFVGTAKDLLGKRLVIEEDVRKASGAVNPKTGKPYTDSYNYYPVGVPSKEDSHSQPIEWQETIQPAPTNNTPAIEPAGAGSGPNGELSIDEAEIYLASLIDGKNDIEARAIVKEVPELKANGQFMIRFIQGKATQSLLDKGYMTKDESGTYTLVSN